MFWAKKPLNQQIDKQKSFCCRRSRHLFFDFASTCLPGDLVLCFELSKSIKKYMMLIPIGSASMKMLWNFFSLQTTNFISDNVTFNLSYENCPVLIRSYFFEMSVLDLLCCPLLPKRKSAIACYWDAQIEELLFLKCKIEEVSVDSS